MKLDGIAHDIQGDGEWLLMINGIGAPRQSWSLQIDDLAQRFRCITFDNPGIGESDGLPGSPTTADLAATAARLLGLLGVERAHVLGVSMGGAIVQQLALDHPALVDRAAIVCSWAACDDYLTRCFEIMRDIAASHDGAGWSVPVQRFLSLIGFAQASFTERFEIVAAIEKAVAEATEAGREELAATFVAQANACLGHDTRARLQTIKAPCLILAGEADRFTPVHHSRALAEGIPDATFDVMKGCGHVMFYERAAAFNQRIVDFLDG